MRARYTVEDTYSFILDILNRHEDAIMFKSAEFIKRKVRRFKNRIGTLETRLIWIKNIIVEGVKHTIHGLKDFGADSKWLI